MEDAKAWISTLEEALDKKRAHLEGTAISRLKEYLGVYQTIYENIYNILLRKSFIREDPYKYDGKITEVAPPSSEDFLESDRLDQMSQRLSAFHTQLGFLNTTYQFSLDFLDLPRIRRIAALMRYINWGNLTAGSANAVSRNLADMLSRINVGSDVVSSQIISDSQNQIARLSSQISAILNEITTFHRESYKLELRQSVLPRIGLDIVQSTQAVQAIKQAFPEAMPDSRYYPELVQEVLQEESPVKGDELKEKVLASLEVKEESPKRKREEVPSKEVLLQTAKIIASAGYGLEDILRKLGENVQILSSSRGRGTGWRIRRFFMRLAGRREEAGVYEIEYFDVASATTKTEKIVANNFMEDLQKKTKLYLALAGKTSPAINRLRTASEKQLFDFVSRHISSLQSLHKRLTGLNNYFKKLGATNRREKLKGFQVELSIVKNSILKANQKRHEFVSLQEESAQMKRLEMDKEAP